ncbi:MAG TPA: hypothetical protein VGE13_01445 [Candidatus Saccharimonadales bacterium]
MSERLQQDSEQSLSKEQLDDQTKELHESLQEKREQSVEHERHTAENNADKARDDIERIEKSREKDEKPLELSPAERRKARTADRRKLNTDMSFKKTMTETQSHMSGPSRAFSKFIHVKAVEKASEAVGSTIARPNALLLGSVFAFLFTVVIYVWTKNAGYPLSGFETIAAFIVGYLVGIIVDFVRIMVTGKQ